MDILVIVLYTVLILVHRFSALHRRAYVESQGALTNVECSGSFNSGYTEGYFKHQRSERQGNLRKFIQKLTVVLDSAEFQTKLSKLSLDLDGVFSYRLHCHA